VPSTTCWSCCDRVNELSPRPDRPVSCAVGASTNPALTRVKVYGVPQAGSLKAYVLVYFTGMVPSL
jgi:hypothetical protein